MQMAVEAAKRRKHPDLYQYTQVNANEKEDPVSIEKTAPGDLKVVKKKKTLRDSDSSGLSLGSYSSESGSDILN